MPPAKKESSAASSRAKSTTRKTTSAPKAAQTTTNARHIEENKKEIRNNTNLIHILYGFIIVLMIVIAGLAFYIGTIFWDVKNPLVSNGTPSTPEVQEISVTVIDDIRCNECQTDAIVGELEKLPFLSQATFINKDFSDKGVEMYLKENNIATLPAVIFNTAALYDGGQLTPYLTALPDGQYSLTLGATFNPFAKRSDRGFLMVDQDIVEQIKETAHYQGDTNAKVTWLEFSDVNCFYCKKMAKDGTYETVKESIPEGFNHTIYNFIGVGGAQTQSAAEVLECIAKIGGSDAYASIFHKSLVEEKSTTDDLLTYAQEAD